MSPMHPPAFGFAAWETLCILACVIAMLISNKIRVDMIGVFILLALGVTGLVKENQLFAGFGNEALILIATMLALGRGLMESGVTDVIASYIARVSGRRERRLLSLLMLVGGVVSSVISDLALVSIFLPMVLGFEKRLKLRASRILLPLAIASMMGGLMTMVGSASNILANQILRQSEGQSLSLFAIAPLGFSLLAAAILFILLFGKYLLPGGEAVQQSSTVGIHEYLTELLVTEDSAWHGRVLRDIHFFRDHGVNVVRILRDTPVHFPTADTMLKTGDILLVQAHRDDLLKLNSTTDYSVQSTVHNSLEEAGIGLVSEVIVRDRSEFIGSTLQQVRFREQYNVTVLALWRNGQTMTQRLAQIRMKAGDMLLLHGPTDNMERLARHEGLLMLSKAPYVPSVYRRGKWAVTILLLTFLLAAFKLLPMAVAGILGLTLMILCGILRLNQVYRAVDWRVLVFVAAMIPLSDVMGQTGIVAYVSQELVQMLGHSGPYALLAACFCLTALLTQVMSNTPTTLLLTPVVIHVAKTLHYSPIPFVITVIVAVTASPLTYISHKVFLIIMGPGGYRYQDYVRLGAPLTLVFFVITMVMVPHLWPF